VSSAVHTRYVLDASVAAKWFTRHDEADRHKAIALRALHASGRCALVVPEFSLLEILNAVRFSGRAVEDDAARALALLEKLRLDVVSLEWELLRESMASSWASGLSMYDAAYVALAERLGVPIVTADDVMVRKLSGRASVIRLHDLRVPG
jgi:predicted nucleic acid-binding protein